MSDTTKQPHNVITRFPPSPTGSFHVGSAHTALFNFIFAYKHGGKMLLRFEDTDKERSERKYEKEIIRALDWLGIEYHAPIRQSERTAIYARHLTRMMEEGHAYVSTEKAGERELVIRFRNPNTTITFNDIIRGNISFDTEDLGDFVIAKSLEEPLYHLAVVVDDYESGVTHIIRGEDGISNTPRHILIQEAIGAPRPIYAHIPLILGADKSKLSKRHGAVSIREYKRQGFLPEALVNYLALLGWHPEDEREILSLDEIVKEFEIEDVQKGGAVFNTEKLKWVNKHYLRSLSDDRLLEAFTEWVPADIKKLPEFNESRARSILPVLRERLEAFSDIPAMAQEGELEYFFEAPGYYARSLSWKGEVPLEKTRKHLIRVQEMLEFLTENNFDKMSIKHAVWEYANEQGRGDVLWPMRYALSGVDRSPDPFELAEIFGKTETMKRLSTAVEKINREL